MYMDLILEPAGEQVFVPSFLFDVHVNISDGMRWTRQVCGAGILAQAFAYRFKALIHLVYYSVPVIMF